MCCEVTYKDGQRQGPGRMFYTTGVLYATETYEADALHGPTTTYYPTGVLQAELHYVRGELDGTAKEYYDDGRLESVIEYRAGKRHGRCAIYDRADNVEREEQWDDGALVSPASAGSPRASEPQGG